MSNTITVRVDNDTKESANRIFKEVGLDMSTAVNMFLKQVIRNNGLPFMVTANIPNGTTLEAIKEADNGNMATFSSIDDLMEDLND